MRHSSLMMVVASIAALSLGCGGGDDVASRTTAPGKPTDEIGGESLVFPARAALPESRGAQPSPDSLELRVYHPSPVGPIGEDARDGYRIYLEAENVSDTPIALEPAWVRAVVRYEGAPVADCAGDAIPVRDGGSVGTSGALFVSVPLPCALGVGEYDVALTFAIGAPPGEPGVIVERTLESPLVVDASLPPYAPGWMPPVE